MESRSADEEAKRFERRWALAQKDPAELTDAELVDVLRGRYEPTAVPPCRECGGPLSIAAMGGGHPTIWACSPTEDNPDKPGYVRFKAGRGTADRHFARSEWVDRGQGGDRRVLELLSRFTGAAVAAAPVPPSDAQKLADAIAQAAHKAGIYNGEVPLTGPHLLLLLDDLVSAATSNKEGNTQ